MYTKSASIPAKLAAVSPSKKQIGDKFQHAEHRRNLLRTAFPGMHKLASHNECDQLIADQSKIDTKCFAITEILRSHPKLAVIIRKNQTKTDLARYLHAACFSPVRSTWKEGIENNPFST